MRQNNPPVWECEHQIVVNTGPEVIWRMWEDVGSWAQWNAGIETIEIDGPFQAGTRFMMKPPGQAPLVSRLVEVQSEVGFVDETCVDELRIFVDHRLERLDPHRTRVIYSLEAFGPGCETVGPAVSADFPDVLRALAARAEAMACERV